MSDLTCCDLSSLDEPRAVKVGGNNLQYCSNAFPKCISRIYSLKAPALHTLSLVYASDADFMASVLQSPHAARSLRVHHDAPAGTAHRIDILAALTPSATLW